RWMYRLRYHHPGLISQDRGFVGWPRAPAPLEELHHRLGLLPTDAQVFMHLALAAALRRPLLQCFLGLPGQRGLALLHRVLWGRHRLALCRLGAFTRRFGLEPPVIGTGGFPHRAVTRETLPAGAGLA